MVLQKMARGSYYFILCPALHIQPHNQLTTTLGGRNDYRLGFKDQTQVGLMHTYTHVYDKISLSTRMEKS